MRARAASKPARTRRVELRNGRRAGFLSVVGTGGAQSSWLGCRQRVVQIDVARRRVPLRIDIFGIERAVREVPGVAQVGARGAQIEIDSLFQNCTIELGERTELVIGPSGVLADCEIVGAGHVTVHGKFFERKSPGIVGLRQLHVTSAGVVVSAVTQNPDRTRANPNLLLWKLRPWLIDHGSALTFHYDWRSVTESSPRETTSYVNHVFEARTALLPRFDATLARLVNEYTLTHALADVPDELLEATNAEPAARVRAAYHAFLWKRLKPPRPFVPALDF